MSLSARRELLERIRNKYQTASGNEKTKILDAFVQSSGYRRKYAISLLNKTEADDLEAALKIRQRHKVYDDEVKQAFLAVWRAANEICPKRLVPFLPRFLESLEAHGHLIVSERIRSRLLNLSAATADRMLKSERQKGRKKMSTTKSGTLLKKQIPIRTFADWSDVTPGFVEADLVAHCGTRIDGAFLNTLTITDIATGWTEVIPLLRKSEADFQSALVNIRSILPFPLLGLDTDNGSEFINHGLLKYCEAECITFTRSRAYRKNDQAHVEEKNGSIVRRVVGYDRFEGLPAWRAMAALYAKLRLYVNYFQPSQKLLLKRREGSKTIKRYDQAKTPCQRLLDSPHVPPAKKQELQTNFRDLDPVSLLQQIRLLQDELNKHAWLHSAEVDVPNLVAETIAKIYELKEPQSGVPKLINYSRSKVPRKPMPPRTHRTRKDQFEKTWVIVNARLKINPTLTAKDLLDELIAEYPGEHDLKQKRTLQRRILAWRQEQYSLEAHHRKLTLDATSSINIFTDLAELATRA